MNLQVFAVGCFVAVTHATTTGSIRCSDITDPMAVFIFAWENHTFLNLRTGNFTTVSRNAIYEQFHTALRIWQTRDYIIIRYYNSTRVISHLMTGETFVIQYDEPADWDHSRGETYFQMNGSVYLLIAQRDTNQNYVANSMFRYNFVHNRLDNVTAELDWMWDRYGAALFAHEGRSYHGGYNAPVTSFAFEDGMFRKLSNYPKSECVSNNDSHGFLELMGHILVGVRFGYLPIFGEEDPGIPIYAVIHLGVNEVYSRGIITPCSDILIIYLNNDATV